VILIFFVRYEGMFSFIFNTIVQFSNFTRILIITIVIMKKVKILYFLPNVVYRIAVRDNKGNPLYDHDWKEMNITETAFSGFS